MDSNYLIEEAKTHLKKLCVDITERYVGSKGNLQATNYLKEKFSQLGFIAETPEFDCFDWTDNGAKLSVNGQNFEVFISPYSLAADVTGPLCVVSTVDELESVDGKGKVVLLNGDIAKEQLFPKNFTFYNPDEHKKIVKLLETKGFMAVISATSKNPAMAGGVYPFSLIEDGDFELPSAFMKNTEGEKLAVFEGRHVKLVLNAIRTPSKGYNVIARKGQGNQKIFVTAHIDSKKGTPGAIDDGTGIVVLLLLAELLKDYHGEPLIEFGALNGEDYYACPGEILYLKENLSTLPDIKLVVNIDGVGFYEGKTSYSFYECDNDFIEHAKTVLEKEKEFVNGKVWYQGDHMIFVQNGRPAIAFTTENMSKVWANVAHTEKDSPEIVDYTKVIKTALAIKELIKFYR